MKKSESVKFRVDIDTYAALVRHCQQTGGNLSQVLRGFILRELEEQADAGAPATAAGLDRRSNPALDVQERSACARVLATVLLGQGAPSSQSRGWKSWTRRRREITRLLESLFQELAPVPPGRRVGRRRYLSQGRCRSDRLDRGGSIAAWARPVFRGRTSLPYFPGRPAPVGFARLGAAEARLVATGHNW